MNIVRYNDLYLKITSDNIQGAIGSPDNVQAIEVSGLINCCKDNCGNSAITKTMDLTSGLGVWLIDLTQGVDLATTLQEINIRNIVTGQIYNILSSPIDLGYVTDNCNVESCTMEDFSGTFITPLQDAINDFFDGLGITTSIIVDIQDNNVSFDTLPDNFILLNANIGGETPFIPIPFGYGSTVGSGMFLGTDGLYLSAEFFDLNAFVDGIYTFSVKIIDTANGYIKETGCFFLDIYTKCLVAATLKSLFEESKDKKLEQVATTIHMLHYALVNGSNCNCNCDEMCTVYIELSTLLSSLQTDNTDNTTNSTTNCTSCGQM